MKSSRYKRDFIQISGKKRGRMSSKSLREEDHLVNGGSFHYYFGQRGAIETFVYLVEVEKGLEGFIDSKDWFVHPSLIQEIREICSMIR
jgi:hypothetical protein